MEANGISFCRGVAKPHNNIKEKTILKLALGLCTDDRISS
jgi:hypothetical protein